MATTTTTSDVALADVTQPPRETRFPLGGYDRKPERTIAYEWVVVREPATGDEITLRLRCSHTRGSYYATINNARHEAHGTWCEAPMAARRGRVESTSRYAKSQFEAFAARALEDFRALAADGLIDLYLRGEAAPSR